MFKEQEPIEVKIKSRFYNVTSKTRKSK